MNRRKHSRIQYTERTNELFARSKMASPKTREILNRSRIPCSDHRAKRDATPDRQKEKDQHETRIKNDQREAKKQPEESPSIIDGQQTARTLSLDRTSSARGSLSCLMPILLVAFSIP